MKCIEINMKVADDGLLRMSSHSANMDVATRFDDNAQALKFNRPEGYENDDLILIFSTPASTFESAPDTNGEYILTPELTQHRGFTLYSTFLRNGHRIENSNGISFRLRDFPGDGEPIPPAPPFTRNVSTKPNEITAIWETGGVPMYWSVEDALEKPFAIGGGVTKNDMVEYVAEQIGGVFNVGY